MELLCHTTLDGMTGTVGNLAEGPNACGELGTVGRKPGSYNFVTDTPWKIDILPQ